MLGWQVRKSVAAALALVLSIPGFPSQDKQSPKPISHAGPVVAVNRDVPRVQPPPRELRFSAFPGDAEISRASVFPVPLTNVNPAASWRENRALARALEGYRRASSPEDLSAFGDFLADYPQSGWKASLLGNMGLVFRRAGRFQRGIDAFEEAWKLTRSSATPAGHAIGNWAAGELAQMHSHLGDRGRIAELLQEVRGRSVMGPATEQLQIAKEALLRSESHPEHEYRCGPMAIASLLSAAGREVPAALLETPASAQGMSMAQLQSLGAQSGVPLFPIHRSPGSPVPVPSIVHWKVDHYSAILERRIENRQEYYLIENPLFEDRIWVTRQALDEETTGFHLALDRDVRAGWRTPAPAETGAIFGRCWRGELDDEQTRCLSLALGGDRPSCPNCPCEAPKNMPEYRFHAMVASLHIADQPVGYSPPVGPPVRLNLYYNQRDAYQPPANLLAFSNLGPKWTFDWISYVEDDGPASLGRVQVYVRGGGVERYNLRRDDPPAGLRLYTRAHYQSQASLAVAAGRTTEAYERRLPDGGREVFALAQNLTGRDFRRRLFLTEFADPAGNTVRLTYDSRFRIIAVTDAIGQVTRLSYDLAADALKVTRVTDPFGRSAAFEYDAQGRLIRITDVLGLSTSFTYDADFVLSMTTPYGTTTFRRGLLDDPFLITSFRESSRWLEATDPAGETERLEFRSRLRPLPAPLEDGTLYWDKRAWKLGGRDLANATHIRWKLVGATLMSGVPWRIKPPLESETVYSHPGDVRNTPDQLGDVFNVGPNSGTGLPAAITRVLEGGVTQTTRFEYNSRGYTTRVIDPAGRSFSFAYTSDGIDLLEAFNDRTRERLFQATYNSQHLPLTVVDAARQTSRYTYNSRGQMLTFTDARNAVITYTYDARGYLTTITGPVPQSVTRLTYDTYGRIATVTGPDGYRLSFSYDVSDRLVRITYPDGTFEQVRYDRLDPVEQTDRQGRVTRFEYDQMRRPVSTTDPLGRVTHMSWCDCGGPEQITDPAGNITTWTRDLKSRIISRTLPNGATTRYAYGEQSGRLLRITDPKGQTTHFDYTIDDNLSRISFENATIPTAPIRFTYDENYDRPVSVEDSSGTMQYTYHPIGSLGALRTSVIEGQIPGSRVELGYDVLGRVVRQSINGITSTSAYDLLGRVERFENALGTFTVSYQDATSRPAAFAYPNGQRALFSYFDSQGDFRLRQLRHQSAAGGVLSEFGFAYEPTGELKTLTRTQEGLDNLRSTFDFRYDAAGRLTGARLSAEDGSALADYRYEYDPADNRSFEDRNGEARSAEFDATNQLVALQYGDSTRAFQYDANGNLLNDGVRTFEWDAMDRLVAISSGQRRTEFTYDSMNRRTRMVESQEGTILRSVSLLWCGSTICELRQDGAVRSQYFTTGEINDGVPTYYTRDQQGTVRQWVGATGSDLAASFDYDPYGRRVASAPATEPSIGFTGHTEYAGLLLAPFRAYDPDLGRWISRDPIGEAGGPNHYAYTSNDPVNLVDPEGLIGEQTPDRLVERFKGYAPPGRINQIIREASAEFRAAWQQSKKFNIGVGNRAINRYFAKHPQRYYYNPARECWIDLMHVSSAYAARQMFHDSAPGLGLGVEGAELVFGSAEMAATGKDRQFRSAFDPEDFESNNLGYWLADHTEFKAPKLLTRGLPTRAQAARLLAPKYVTWGTRNLARICRKYSK